MISRRDKIIDWAYDSNKTFWNVPAKVVILVTAIYWNALALVRVQREINRGEATVVKDKFWR